MDRTTRESASRPLFQERYGTKCMDYAQFLSFFCRLGKEISKKLWNMMEMDATLSR